MPTYQEQLQSDEWQRKRFHILNRDGMKCIRCNIGRSPLINMIEKFGIKEFEEKRLKLLSPENQERTHFNLGLFVPEYGLHEIKYLDDEALEFDLDNLQFGKTYEYVDLGILGRTRTVRYICFYSGLLKRYGEMDLNVHHSRYVIGKLAWEYEDEDLETLCVGCHELVHKEKAIPIFTEEGELIGNIQKCNRCGGSGYLKEFDYYMEGECFSCHGTGGRIDDYL